MQRSTRDSSEWRTTARGVHAASHRPGFHARAVQRPKLTTLLCRFARAYVPHFRFTSIQALRRTLVPPRYGIQNVLVPYPAGTPAVPL